MANKWYKRYYSTTKKDLVEYTPTDQLDSTFTDSIYDSNKGISHILFRYTPSGNFTRYVSDVEIAMTSDVNLSSYFTSEHRAVLKNNILGQQRSPSSIDHPTDDQLLENGAIPTQLERDEIVQSVKTNYDRLDLDLHVNSVKNSPKVSDTPSTDSTNKTQ